MRTPSVCYQNHKELQLSRFDLQSGFTLIEVMIVMTIIGILSAVGVVSYQTQVRKTQLMSIYQEVNYLRMSYQVLFDEGTEMTGFNLSSLNIPIQTEHCLYIVTGPNAVGAASNAIQCQIQNLNYISNQTLSLDRSSTGSWTCRAYLPQACR